MGNIKISGTTNQNARVSVFTDDEYLGYKDITTGAYSIVMRHPQPDVPTLSDDFTGTNGNPPDADRWQIMQGSPEIQSNNLYLNILAASETTHEMRSRYVLSGNLSIEMPFDLTGLTNNGDWYLQLSVLDPERMNGGKIYVRHGRYIHTLKVTDGVETETDNMFMGDAWNAGGIKIVRSGSNWNTYRKDAGSWWHNGDHNWIDGYTGNVKVEVKAWHANSFPAIDPDVLSVDILSGTPVVSGTGSADLNVFARTSNGEILGYGSVTAIDTSDAVSITEWPTP